MKDNPFCLTFGIEPSNAIKRIKDTNEVISSFSGDVSSNYLYFITGLRGSGKTVLLSSISSAFS